MFKDPDGNKLSAKGMAQQLVADAVFNALLEPDMEGQRPTDRERAALQEQLLVVGNRVMKMLKREPITAEDLVVEDIGDSEVEDEDDILG